MSAPHAHSWEEVPPDVQEKVRFLYGALLEGAIEEDANRAERGPHYYSKGLMQWDYLPDRMRTAMANMLMVQRHEVVRALTALHQSILGDVVHPRGR